MYTCDRRGEVTVTTVTEEENKAWKDSEGEQSESRSPGASPRLSHQSPAPSFGLLSALKGPAVPESTIT